MNLNEFSLDSKLTLAVYCGAALLFILFLVWMFVYSSRMKAAKKVEAAKGRPPADLEEGILIATREKEGREIPKP